MQQLEAPTVLHDLVRAQEAGLARPGREVRVLRGADDEEELVRVGVERHERDRERRLVVLEIELVDRGGLRVRGLSLVCS